MSSDSQFFFFLLDIKQDELREIAKFEQQEVLLSFRSVTKSRAPEEMEKQLQKGTAIRLTYDGMPGRIVDGRHVFTFVLTAGSASIHLEEDSFPIFKWIIVPDTPDGLIYAQHFSDLAKRHSIFGQNFAILHKVLPDRKVEVKMFTMNQMSSATSYPSKKGDGFLLLRRFTDFSTASCIRSLVRADKTGNSDFGNFLQSPETWSACRISRSYNIDLTSAAMNDLYPSQKEAVKGALSREKSLTVLWGPAGSGKTHTLSRMLRAAVDATSDQSVFVLIAASTNSAIETLMSTCRDLNMNGVLVRTIQRDVKDASRGISLESVSRSFNLHRKLILGATPWRVSKIPDSGVKFDLVIVDEASQMRTGHASILFERLKIDGRLIVVGDHKQLRPITQDLVSSAKNAFALSLLEFCMRELSTDSDLLFKLRENLRMNDVLGRYAQLVYGSDYCVVKDNEGMRLENDQNPFEFYLLEDASYEPSLVLEQLKRLKDTVGSLEWTQYVLVIAPHHVQRKAISLKVIKHFGSDVLGNLFIDTVEKVQGRTADVVIVALGNLNPLDLEKEASFCFDVRRLTVALTRARKKLILFVGRNFLNPSLFVLANQEARAGHNLILHFINQGSLPHGTGNAKESM